MNDISLVVQINLAIHIGLIAVILTIFLWRITDTNNLVKQILLLKRIKNTGFTSIKDIFYYKVAAFQLIIRILASIIFLLPFYFTFRYLHLLERLVGPYGNSLDYSIFIGVFLKSEEITKMSIKFSLLVCIFFLIDFLVSLLINAHFSQVNEKSIPDFYHVRLISKKWFSSPEAMWENRIKSINDKLIINNEITLDFNEPLKDRKWLYDWPTWSKCVIGYQILTSRELKNKNFDVIEV
jgi:hypothetical protein